MKNINKTVGKFTSTKQMTITRKWHGCHFKKSGQANKKSGHKNHGFGHLVFGSPPYLYAKVNVKETEKTDKKMCTIDHKTDKEIGTIDHT